MASSGKGSKRKGYIGEHEFVGLLQENGIEARRGRCELGEPDVLGLDGIHIEIKRQERLKPYEYMEQARAETKKKDPEDKPVVFMRMNNKPWLAMMDFETFMDLYKRANNE